MTKLVVLAAGAEGVPPGSVPAGRRGLADPDAERRAVGALAERARPQEVGGQLSGPRRA